MFKLENCKIRKAELSDLEGLKKIARTIWEGTDYLPIVAEKWINEGGFFVAEHENTLVGCTKISRFPANVMWFEGLRVHGRYQGLGIGKLLNAFAFQYAIAARKSNPELKFEFCTYYKNIESIHLAQKLGFEIVEEYYVLAKRGLKRSLAPQMISDFDMDIFAHYPNHIPCGWRAIYNLEDSKAWIRSNCRLFQTPASSYLVGGLSGNSILPLGEPQRDLRKELPYFQHFYGSYKSIELILPKSWQKMIPDLLERGFRFWDQEAKPNMYIFKAKI
jgi:N-acetylglutamate synthase-like GNAT family acetyltransferase